MVSISLFIEFLRARPLTLFWAMAATQLVFWTLVPALFYTAPSRELAMVLAVGREFAWGTEYGPPLAFWLAELAYRAGGMFGLYLISQICIVTAFWAVLSLGRAIVGTSLAVMAVSLMAGIALFWMPSTQFGPGILAAPLWALILLHHWRASTSGDWKYWLAAGVEIGLLLLTTQAGLILVGLLLVWTMTVVAGRATLETIGPWLAGLLAIAVLFPYLIWIDLAGGVAWPDMAAISANLRAFGLLVAVLVVSHAGMVLLLVLGHGYLIGIRGPAADIVGRDAEPAARRFVYFFALAPMVALALLALFTQRPENFVAVPLALLSGLVAIVALAPRIRLANQYLIGHVWGALLLLPPLLTMIFVAIQPWILAADLWIGRPAVEIGQFFGDVYMRRTGRTLPVVAGDPDVAALVALTAHNASDRPSLYQEPVPGYPPRVPRSDISDKGALIVWRAADPNGQPPPEIARLFPNLSPEVPRAFAQRFQGRMQPLRIGWAMVRPGSADGSPVPRAPAPEPPPPPIPQAPPEPELLPQAAPLPLPAPQRGTARTPAVQSQQRSRPQFRPQRRSPDVQRWQSQPPPPPPQRHRLQ